MKFCNYQIYFGFLFKQDDKSNDLVMITHEYNAPKKLQNTFDNKNQHKKNQLHLNF